MTTSMTTSMTTTMTKKSSASVSTYNLIKHLLISLPGDLKMCWPVEMTIMLRMTSKSIKEAIDKVKLPTSVSLIWQQYKNNIIKINSSIRCLNITCFTIKTKKDRYKDEYEQEPFDYFPEDSYSDDDDKIYEYEEDNDEDELLKLLEIIFQNKDLTVLNLIQCGLNNNSLQNLKESFKKLHNLSDLNLSSNNFILSLDFIEILMLLPKLVNLNLNSNRHIFRNLQPKQTLQLNIVDNIYTWNLQPEQTLQLKKLSLSSCLSNYTKDINNILELIKISPQLDSFDFSDNGDWDEYWDDGFNEKLI